MSNEAWMVRLGERERLVKTLVGDFGTYADNHPEDVALWAVLRITLDYLKDSTTSYGHSLSDDFFYKVVLERINGFARATEEKEFLLASFAEALCGSLRSSFSSKLTSREIADPQLILRAPSGMTEQDPSWGTSNSHDKDRTM